MSNSEKKYISPSSGISVTSSQYITELLILRKYELKQRKLPVKFWTIPKYKKEFQQTIFWVNKFLRLYPDNHEVVINVLRRPEFCRTYTLNNDRLKFLIDEEIEKIKLLSSKEEKKYENNIESLPAKVFKKPNMFTKLDG